MNTGAWTSLGQESWESSTLDPGRRHHRAVDGEGLREGAKPEVAEAVCRWPCGRRRDGASGWGNCFRCSCGHIMKLSWDPVGNWELTICSIVDIVGPKWELGI